MRGFADTYFERIDPNLRFQDVGPQKTSAKHQGVIVLQSPPLHRTAFGRNRRRSVSSFGLLVRRHMPDGR